MPAIVPRAEWGARPAKSVHRIPTPTPRLWVHHAADDRQGAAAVRAHQVFHQNTRGWADIAYSFLIGNDGTIYEGRGAGVAGGHTAGDNTRSHAICLLGNFDNRAPTPQSLDSLVWLARHGTDRRWWVPTLGGHRDAPGASTACPGRHLYAALPGVRARLAAPVPTVPQEDPHMSAEDVANLHKAVRSDLLRLASFVMGGRTNAVFNHQTVQDAADNEPGIANITSLNEIEDLLDQGRLELIAAAGAIGAGVGKVDPAEVARHILAGLDPAAIAAAIPDTFAGEVVDELHRRLAG